MKFVAHTVAGQSPPSVAVTYDIDGLPFLQGNAEFGQLNPTPCQVCNSAPKRAAFGDILVSVRAPVGAINIADQPYGIGRGLCAIQPASGIDRMFCYYKLMAMRHVLGAVATGSTYDGVKVSDVGNIPMLLPHRIEQLSIAAFLDHETAKIDKLIERKERLIELLSEKRTALITHAVTRGLDPDVPMKDSGVEWLGVIPRHWEVYQLRRVVSKFIDYRGKTPKKTSSGVPLVTARNIKNQSIDLSLSEEFIPDVLYPHWMVRGHPERGDVLITTEAPLGESAQVFDTGIALAQRIILLKSNATKVTNDYLKYHFAADSGRMELRSRATGSTVFGIKASHLKASIATVPPLREQKNISRAIDSGLANVDLIIAKIRQAIDLLNEFRTALISAAVTGKIDIRTASTDATAGQGGMP